MLMSRIPLARANKIDFVDIAALDYDPQQNSGITYEQAMAVIHAITAEGQVVTGVEVFRRLYEAVGLGWVYGVTSYAPVGRAAEALYSFWAKYRMEVTGRQGGLEAVLERKRAERAGRQGSLCEGQQDCELPAARASAQAPISASSDK